MTSANMVAYLESMLDELVGGQVPTFWKWPDDAYTALTWAQKSLTLDAIKNKEWQTILDLIVKESVADGATLANTAQQVFSAYDTTNDVSFMPSNGAQFPLYADITLPFFGQWNVAGNVLHTTPAGKTLQLIYVKQPDVIDAGHDSVLSVAAHFEICERAAEWLLPKDLTAPMQELLEQWRDKVEQRKAAKKEKAPATPQIPTLPYQ